MRIPGQTRTVFAVAGLAVLAVGIAAVAVIFSIAKGTSEVAANGTTAILEEATLSAAAATHNSAAQSIVIADAHEIGFAELSDLQESIGRTEEAAAELARRTEQLTGELSDNGARATVEAESDALQQAVAVTLWHIRASDPNTSRDTAESDLRANYEAFVTTLAELRNEAYTQITIARKDAGRLADAARFLVVLLVPATILITYRSRIRRAQKQAELESELAKEQAVSRTKSDFIAHISHQLRTPLTGIYGSALALNDPAAGSNGDLSQELTAMITEESAELARMVEDILAVAAEDQGQLSVDIAEIDPVIEILGVLEPLDLVGQTTGRELRPGTAMADARHFRQVISNLVSNAHRYGEPPVTISGRATVSGYVIEVTDCGSGVDPEIEERLFNRYVHEGDAPLLTGTIGLGLSVAQLLITRMHGTINYSRRARTTVFTITLPDTLV